MFFSLYARISFLINAGVRFSPKKSQNTIEATLPRITGHSMDMITFRQSFIRRFRRLPMVLFGIFCLSQAIDFGLLHFFELGF
jgi:hypothetical protein